MIRHSGKRKVIRNFFIKPQLQIRLTMVFIGAALFASFITLGIIFLLTRINIDGLEGLRTAWYYLKATFPGFWIAAGVSVFVGFIVGTWASRKVALPVYKVEQWSRGLNQGDLTIFLGMRETDFWGEMAISCNGFTKKLRRQLQTIQTKLENDDETISQDIKQLLEQYKI
jgi:hypothetical protein